MVLGGSTTYGFGVHTNEHTFPGRLESCLNQGQKDLHYEVINAGVRGFNLFLLLRHFESFGLSYHPHQVICFVNALDSQTIRGPLTLHDLWDMNPDTRKTLVRSWIDATRSETKDNDSDEKWVLSLQQALSPLRLYKLLVRNVTAARSDSLKPLALWTGALKDINPPEDYRKNLKDLILLCKKNKIDLVLVNEFDPFNAESKNPKRKILNAVMKEEALKNEIPFFDLQEEFLRRPDALELFFNEPTYQFHYNKQGHQAVGERLCRWIKENSP
jgi:hypothetical protein